MQKSTKRRLGNKKPARWEAWRALFTRSSRIGRRSAGRCRRWRGRRQSYDADLLTRAADVQLKEGRPVILLVREAPLHLGHLRLMVQAAEIGCVIFPPAPAFYARPQTIDDVVDGTVGRVLARIGLENDLYYHWRGMRAAGSDHPRTGTAGEPGDTPPHTAGGDR